MPALFSTGNHQDNRLLPTTHYQLDRREDTGLESIPPWLLTPSLFSTGRLVPVVPAIYHDFKEKTTCILHVYIIQFCDSSSGLWRHLYCFCSFVMQLCHLHRCILCPRLIAKSHTVHLHVDWIDSSHSPPCWIPCSFVGLPVRIVVWICLIDCSWFGVFAIC